MIERQVLRSEDAPTVLTSVVIAQQDVFARQAFSLERDVNVFDQPDHRRHRHRKPRRVQPLSGAFFGVGYALENQHNRAAGRADIDRLEGSVKDENASVHTECEI